jgi:hypothetical protein
MRGTFACSLVRAIGAHHTRRAQMLVQSGGAFERTKFGTP